MNTFIEISDSDLVVALGDYANTLSGASPAITSAQDRVKAGKAGEVLKDIIAHAHLFYQDQDNLEMVINSLSRALRAAKAEERANLTKQLACKLSDTSDPTKSTEILRFVSLVSMFNLLEKASPARVDVFTQVVAFAGQIGQLEAISAQLTNIPVWVKEWQLDVAQTRSLYRLAYKSLLAASAAASSPASALSLSKLAADLLIRLTATYPAGSAELAAARAETDELITLALTHESIVDVFSILSLEAVKALKGEAHVKLLELIQAGDLAGFSALVPTLTATFAKHGLKEEKVSRKIRLMLLARVFATKSTLAFAEVAEALKVDLPSVENWVIDGIRAGLVEAKVDELHQTIVVTRTTYTEFSRQNWEDLQARVGDWKKNISEVQRTLDQVKLQIQRQLQSASGGSR